MKLSALFAEITPNLVDTNDQKGEGKEDKGASVLSLMFHLFLKGMKYTMILASNSTCGGASTCMFHYSL